MKKWQGLVFVSTIAFASAASLFLLTNFVSADELSSDIKVTVGSMLELRLGSCGSGDANIVNLNFDSPDAAGQFKSDCQNVFVNTNHPGYSLSVKASGSHPNYSSGANTNAMLYQNPTTVNPLPVILSKPSGTIASPSVIPIDNWGYAVENLGGFNTTYTQNLATDKYARMTTTDTQVYKTAVWPLPRTDFKFYYGAKVSPAIMAGSYKTLVTYTVVGEFVPCQWNESISFDNPNCKDWDGMFRKEMAAIEAIVADIIDNDKTRIGTALSSTDYVSIDGINYGTNWYKITAAQLLAAYPDCDTTNADYIVKYTTETAGAVVSIPGRIIDGSIVHSFNYFGETGDIVYDGILTAVTTDSTKNSTQWGEFALTDCSGSGSVCGNGNGVAYTEDGGLVMGEDYGILSIDTSKPVGERYTIGFTIKGPLPQAVSPNGLTVVAISPVSNNYVSWIGFSGNCMSIHAYKVNPVNVTNCANTQQAGFINIDLATLGMDSFNNEFMNIYLSAQRGGDAKVYINGELVRTFPASNAVTGYGTMSIGDLRANRGLKYQGVLYDFMFYSEVLTEAQVKQNFDYSRNKLGF